MWPSSGLHQKLWCYCFTGLVWICHDGEISASVLFVICYLYGVQGGGICNLRYPAGAPLVFLLATVLCGFPVTVFPYPISISGGLLLWVLWRGEKTKE